MIKKLESELSKLYEEDGRCILDSSVIASAWKIISCQQKLIDALKDNIKGKSE